MASVLIVTQEPETGRKLQSELTRGGFTGLAATFKEKIVDRVVREAPQLVILELGSQLGHNILRDVTTSPRIRRKVPVLALTGTGGLNQSADLNSADDFIVHPFDNRELIARSLRLIQKSVHQDEVMRCDDLEIDLANCEVRIAGKIAELTFKEYELLKFLAQEKGRVFSREALLNKVWGYDYFGGDRTVDVHIRRLRSKIEISGQSYIETVRNIGYRFKKCN